MFPPVYIISIVISGLVLVSAGYALRRLSLRSTLPVAVQQSELDSGAFLKIVGWAGVATATAMTLFDLVSVL